MANRELVLDGLAWAFIEEPIRVAIISAMLVKELAMIFSSRLTKTRIKEAVKDTSPPYGRGKAICELVEVETYRQKAIHDRRQAQQRLFREWEERKALMDNRLNDAFSYAFSRPRYQTATSSRPSAYYSMDHEGRKTWRQQTRDRDLGERCLAITHWGDHVVALSVGDNSRYGISTRLRRGEVVKTFLRESCTDLVRAAISLGGPKVKAAFGQGIRVTTDWVGRKTTIHYTDKREVVLPWRSIKYEEAEGEHGPVEQAVATLIQGSVEVLDSSVVPDDD